MFFPEGFQNECNSNLDKLELLFKQLYMEHSKRALHEPHSAEDLNDILLIASEYSSDVFPKMAIDSLLEDTFILGELDVDMYKHIRYLPAMFHQHNFFEIACVLKGNCRNYVLNQTIDMLEGDICIIAPNTRHAISVFSDDSLVLNILVRTSTFEKTFLNLLSEKDILSDFFIRTLYQSKEMPYLIFRTGHDSEITNSIESLFNEIKHNRRYKKRMVNSILNLFFIILLRNHDKDVMIPTLDKSCTDENFLFMLHYMQENYKTITLKHLSEFFNYSERHVQRIIKATTGMNFSEHIQKLKMNHAVELLEKGDVSVSDIAEQLGYSDVSNFRQIFKKFYGMTPMEFRNLNS